MGRDTGTRITPLGRRSDHLSLDRLGRSRLARGAPKKSELDLDAVRILSPVTTPCRIGTAPPRAIIRQHNHRIGRIEETGSSAGIENLELQLSVNGTVRQTTSALVFQAAGDRPRNCPPLPTSRAPATCS